MSHTPKLHWVRDQQALADEKTANQIKAIPDMLEALERAKWLIERYVAKPERYEEYQDVVRAIRKARQESKVRGMKQWGKDTPPENTEDVQLTQVIQLEELGIDFEVMEETGEAYIPF